MTDFNETPNNTQTSLDEDSVEAQENQDAQLPEAPDVETEIALIKDQLLRALAEAENVRKRASKEKEDALKFGVTNFARDLLTVADNLRRALENVSQDEFEQGAPEVKALLEGVTMTEKELLSVFQKHGIQKISPLGERFDHSFHQAMFEVDTDDQPAGTVVQLMQPGYVLHDRLLRPAMVGVAKAKPPEDKEKKQN